MVLEVRRGLSLGAVGKETYAVHLGDLPGGAPNLLPVLTATGKNSGPTLIVCCALRGTAVLGSVTAIRFWESLNVDSLEGSVICLPQINYAAAQTRSRNSEMETYPGPYDMNRCFPGNSAGAVSERVSAHIVEAILPYSDYLVDLHTVADGGHWLPYVSIPAPVGAGEADEAAVWSQSREMGLQFGTPFVIEQEPMPGSLVAMARNCGIPAISAEYGKSNEASATDVLVGTQGLTRVMDSIGRTQSGNLAQDPSPSVLTEVHRIRSGRGGFLSRQVELEDEISAGSTVGEVFDFAGGVVEEVRASVDGIVCRVSTFGLVASGDQVVSIGIPKENP